MSGLSVWLTLNKKACTNLGFHTRKFYSDFNTVLLLCLPCCLLLV